MISKQRIKNLIDEKLSGTDNFLVEIKVSNSNQIKIFIDNMKSLSVKDCVVISRHVESNLDRDVEDFALEVSSPGLGQPFKVLQQYQKNVGRKVEVKTIEGEKHTGELKDVNENGFAIEHKPKKKSEIEKRHEFKYDDVKETKLLISFN